MIYDGVMPDIYVKKRYKKEEYMGFDIEVVKLEDGYVYAQANALDWDSTFFTRARSAPKARSEVKKYIRELDAETADIQAGWTSNFYSMGRW